METNFNRPLGKLVDPRAIKFKLISIRGHICENCNLTLWLGEPIPLQLHHINGKEAGNMPENLQLLCPNCHSLTPNYVGKHKLKFSLEKDLLQELLIKFTYKDIGKLYGVSGNTVKRRALALKLI